MLFRHGHETPEHWSQNITATSAGGDLLLVWTEVGDGPLYQRLMYARLSPTGTIIVPATDIVGTGDTRADRPVPAEIDDAIGLAWLAGESLNHAAAFTTLDERGQMRQPPTALGGAIGHVAEATLAASADAFAVAWTTFEEASEEVYIVTARSD